MDVGSLLQHLRTHAKLVIAASLGGGLVGLAVVAWLWLPGFAKLQAARVIAAKTGLAFAARKASVGLGEITFDDVTLRSPAGGVKASVARIKLDASLFDLPLKRVAAVTRVVVVGPTVELEIGSDGHRSLLERGLSAAKRGSAGKHPGQSAQRGMTGPRAPRPPVVVRRLALAARDDAGSLVELEAGRVKLAGGRLAVDNANVRLGGGEAAAVELDAFALEVGRSEAGQTVLHSCEVGDALVRLRRERSSPQHPVRLRARLRRLVDVDAPPPELEGASSKGASASLDPAHPPLAPAEAPGVDQAPEDGDGAKTREAELEPPGLQAAAPPGFSLDPFTRLEAGSRCAVTQGHVLSTGEEGDKVLMTALSGRLERTEAGRLELGVRGHGATDGRLEVELVMSRAPLRVDGTVKLDSLPLSLVVPVLPGIPWYEPDASRIDAELTVATKSVSEVAAKGSVRVRSVGINAERVAPEPVVFEELHFSGAARFLPLQRRLEIDEAAASAGRAEAELAGAVEWAPDHYVMNLDVTVPRAPCEEVIKSAPAALLGELSQASWSGRISGGVRLRLDSRELDAAELELEVKDGCDFVDMPPMADLRRFRMPFIHSVVEPDAEIFEMETGPGTMRWAYLEDISPFFVHAVLAHEDAQFFNHKGFSPFHIRNALVRNLREGRYVVGASTITMQLVKNIFLHREKTLARKVQEALLTWWIERVMDKRDILELYFNVIEYGPAVYGIKHAAQYYFKRLPSDLSPAEAVFLSTILPAPKRYHSMYQKGAISSGWKERMRAIFRRMRAREWYSSEAVDYGLSELQGFAFVKEGQLPVPRTIPGTTAPLPYQHTGITGSAWDLLFAPSSQGGGPPAAGAAMPGLAP